MDPHTTNQLRELSLFSGGGGGLLASQWLKGWRTVCYVEKDDFATAILKSRIADGLLDDAPIWGDAETFDGVPWKNFVDVISAGFPCQPFSTAGKRLQGDDERNGWPATMRIVREVRPRFVFLENVPGLLTGYIATVLGDLAASRYDATWGVLGADDVGAPHHRKRIWIKATDTNRTGEYDGSEYAKMADSSELIPDTNGKSHRRLAKRKASEKSESGDDIKNVTNADSDPIRIEQVPVCGCEKKEIPWWSCRGEIESEVGRMAHGVANRMGQLRTIGNGQVPIVAAKAWELLND